MTIGNNEQTWNAACGVAMVVLVGLAVLDRTMPRPDDKDEFTKNAVKQQKLVTRIAGSQKILEASETELQGYTWKVSPDQVGPEVLTSLTRLASKHKVKLSNFRPGKVTQADTLQLVQFDANVAGSYVNASEFLRAVELPENLLILQSVQLSNSDGITDDVNVTLNLIGVVEAGKKKA